MLELIETIQRDELVERCRRGDQRSYVELYSKYSKAMYNTSLRIVNHTADAEDVLQESFLDAFQAIERIVINKSINALRKRKMEIIDIEKTSAVNIPEDESFDEEGLRFKVEEIKKAVKELPNGYRTVISLHLFEGYDHEEIAEILQISHATVRTQYMRAKQKLLSLIKQGGLS
jgi:RNA polymerase sigma factor (sigma-70 family)